MVRGRYKGEDDRQMQKIDGHDVLQSAEKSAADETQRTLLRCARAHSSAAGMFTDGLDPSALQWVREGLVPKDRAVAPSILEDIPSSKFVRESTLDARKKGKSGWAGLPPTQLHNVHFHSDIIRQPHFSTALADDYNESVSSASATGHHEYDDDTTDSEDQESGRYSLDSSPRNTTFGQHRGGNGPIHNVSLSTATTTAGCNMTDDYYYEYDRRLLSSRSNSKSNSRSNSRRESFGRLEGRQTQTWTKAKESGNHQYEDDDAKFSSYGRGPYSDEEESWAETHINRYNGSSAKNSSQAFSAAPAYGSSASYPAFSSQIHSESVDQGSHLDGVRCKEQMAAPPSAPPMARPSTFGVSNAESSTSCSLASESVPFVGLKEKDEVVVLPEGAKVSTSQVPRAATAIMPDGKPMMHLDEQIEIPRGQDGDSLLKQTTATSSSQHHSIYSSNHAAWPTVIAYDACVRMCLKAWARGCVEAPEFLIDECLLLRTSFGLKHILLQPRDDLAQNAAVEDPEAIAASKQNKNAGKLRVQVRKVRLTMKVVPKCSFPSFDATCGSLDLKTDLLAGWDSVKKFCTFPRQVSRSSSARATNYMQAGAEYVHRMSELLKASVNSLRSTSLMDAPEETFSCLLRLKSIPEEEAIRMHPGASDSHIFLPESSGDDLLLELQDSRGEYRGRATIQLASLSDEQTDRLRWWSVYNERDQDCIGKIQLFISFTVDSNSSALNKLGIVSETLAYDIALEAAMRTQQFRQGNLRLHGSWKWLLSEFALYYGVSDAYTNLRYLYHVMEIATPTADCLLLIHDLLYPIVSVHEQVSLSRQEKRILYDMQEQVEQLLALAFENYKSLDDSSTSGIAQSLMPIAEEAAPALAPAVKLYTLLHDVLSSEAQTMLRNHFQTAAMKRCRRHMAETDEFVSNNNEGFLIDPFTTSSAYQKMINLCNNLSDEIQTDIKIHNQHILPSAIDLPSLATGIYSVELCKRLRSFLVACPPSSPCSPVIDLLIATADFERNLASWNIRGVKGGVDAKDLFHLYIVLWIQDKRLSLLEFCKLDKVRWTGTTTQHGTSPFVEDMYERIRDTLNEYDILLNRWPEYTVALESAIADVETAIVAALEKQFADVLTPLKDVMVPRKFSIQYVQKLTRRRTLAVYSVPNQLGIFMNTIKRLLDILRPKIEAQMRAWIACLPTEGVEKAGFGERLNEVTVLMRAKYKNFLQAIVEKLFDNACMQRSTKLKKILQDTREAGGESEIRDRMQLLSSQLADTISHLHDVFSVRVFVAICRGYWDRMGQDVLHFLETRKENRSWYKGSSYALTILDDLFATQMQKLQGHSLQEKDLEPPRSVMDARSMLSKDGQLNSNNSSYLYF
ncbi:hypothetical protein GOP47_0029979 [Adiantum capillus-veneris]|nr:hypothetical protein GOP47_0029979 [Adiantum capillus-veneris]